VIKLNNTVKEPIEFKGKKTQTFVIFLAIRVELLNDKEVKQIFHSQKMIPFKAKR
jgi:hypothetical protein